jgi:acyl-coenzyme A thioesterase PaaI-like protein
MIADSNGPTLRAWHQLGRSRFGRSRFMHKVRKRSPYITVIEPQFVELRNAYCRVSMRQRREVSDHSGNIHNLAIATLCDLAAGMVTEVSIPVAMGWTVRGMTIEYLRKAESDVFATARLDKLDWPGTAESIAVPVNAIDENGAEVARAVITMFVSPRRN